MLETIAVILAVGFIAFMVRESFDLLENGNDIGPSL
jgi:hypothetical protein